MNMLQKSGIVLVMAIVTLLTLVPAIWAQEFKKATDCVVGKRVFNRDNQPGTIVSVDGSSCRVKLDATGKIDYNIFWMLRAEGQGKVATKSEGAATGDGISTGLYKCYMLVGTQLNYAFIDIHIKTGNRYSDKSGNRGSYKLEQNGKIVFTGPLAGANAKLLSGGRIGLNMNGGSFYNTTCNK